jgi:hypothetical protein
MLRWKLALLHLLAEGVRATLAEPNLEPQRRRYEVSLQEGKRCREALSIGVLVRTLRGGHMEHSASASLLRFDSTTPGLDGSFRSVLLPRWWSAV